MQAALPAYEERPRTRWLFENSVQNTIVVSRAFFTADVTTAFAEMEDGNENALKARGPLSNTAAPSPPQWQQPGAERQCQTGRVLGCPSKLYVARASGPDHHLAISRAGASL